MTSGTAPGSRLLGNAAITYLSDMVCALFGFVSVVLIARDLGPAGYGIVALSLAVMGIASEVAGIGLGQATVKIAAPFYAQDTQRYRAALYASLKIRLVASTVVLAIGAGFSWAISRALIQGSGGEAAIALAFAGAFATSMFMHVRIVFLCEKRFKALAAVRVATTMGTTATLATLIFLGFLNPSNAVLGYGATPFAAFAIFLAARRKDLRGVYDYKRDLGPLLQFTKWMFGVTMVSVLFTKLDVFFLATFWTKHDVGVYSVAVTLIFPVAQLATAIATVMMPDVSSATSKKEVHSQMKGILRLTVGIAVALLAFTATPLPDKLIPWIFGEEFRESVGPFKVLCITASAMLVSNPLYLAAYPINQPRILFYGDLIKLVLHLAFYALLVPPMGVLGAAWGRAGAMVVGSLISVGLVIDALRRSPDDLRGKTS